jgi:uncharacterized membrane protein YkgB
MNRLIDAAGPVQRAGRAIALIGAVLPLLMIGGMKFTQVEIDGLEPVISGTPWLAWLYPVFGKAGASYFLGIVEISGAALTFLITSSLFLTLPVWEEKAGGFPALNILGQFLLKDVALLGIALVITGEALARMRSLRVRLAQGDHP